MAYVTPPLRATGDIITAAGWNQDVRNNFIAYETHAHTGSQDGASLSGLGLNLIQEQILAAPAAVVTFSNIPTTYRGLELRMVARGTTGASLDTPRLQFNGDTAGNYDYTRHGFINTTAVIADVVGGATSILLGNSPASLAQALQSNQGRIQVHGYYSTIFFKALQSQMTVPNTSGPSLMQVGGIWKSSAPATAISLVQDFASGSQFTLYGLR